VSVPTGPESPEWTAGHFARIPHEVRGPEVTDLLAAMNTGHEGGCGTLHANSAVDVPARIEALAMAAGMPQAAVHSQLRAGQPLVACLQHSAEVWSAFEAVAAAGTLGADVPAALRRLSRLGRV
jgi:pilus assembly protein CpaF